MAREFINPPDVHSTAGYAHAVKSGNRIYVAGQVGGKGGGKPDLAMAGGHQPAAVAGALESVRTWVEGRLP